MKKKATDAQRSITTLPIMPGTLILCGCTLLIFLAVISAMAFAGMVQVPDFLAGFFGQDDGALTDDGFAEDFLASLSGNAPDLHAVNETLLDLSADSLKDLLLSSRPAASYYQNIEVTWTDGASVFRKNQIHYIVSGERVRVECYPIDGVPKYVICNSEHFWIMEGSSARLFSRGDPDSPLSPQSECGIPSLSRMQAMIAEADAGKYSLSLETVMNSPCIRVSFTDTVSGVREVFDVMPDRGVIIAAASYLPGSDMPYYQMSTAAILTDLSGMDESTFDIPDL